MKKGMVVFIALVISIPLVSLGNASLGNDVPLPPPQDTTMILEETIWRRSSIRNFTEEPVTDQDLSTILWAAYGLREDGTRTIPTINGTYAARIYVIRPEAVYTYDPWNNTLVFYKDGDYRSVGQYEAPLLIGLTSNTTLLADGDLACAQLGMMGQNIQFMANALGLGTVVTGDFAPTWTLARIGLPDDEVPRIIMPLGHLMFPYTFKYLPVCISLQPHVKKSSTSLTTALETRTASSTWQGDLSSAEKTQVLWSTYGYSYLVDKSDYGFVYHISRHRTVPSAHGYYVLRIYAVTAAGVHEFVPNIYDIIYGNFHLIYLLPKFAFPVVTYLKKITSGDQRAVVADASSDPAVASAPLLIVIVLDLQRARIGRDDFSGAEWWWLWYFEAGAAAHNVALESAAWNLSTNIMLPTDPAVLRTTLKLNESYVPMLILPVGKP